MKKKEKREKRKERERNQYLEQLAVTEKPTYENHSAQTPPEPRQRCTLPLPALF